MEEIKKIKIFVSCPGDIKNELDSIQLVVKNINKTIGKSKKFIIDFVHWDEDTYTDIGEDGQDVINNQIDYDIIVGIMWLKVGTPTKRDKSGTIEEINRALENKKAQQLIYFKTSTPDNLSDINPEQLEKINSFKKSLQEKGVLYKQFDTTKKFESLFQINLSNLIADKILNNKRSTEQKEPVNSVELEDSNYLDIRSLISEIENSDDSVLDIDIFSMSEETTGYLNTVSTSLRTMTAATTDLGTNLTKRTNELNRIKSISDVRLKQKKSKTIIHNLSRELKEHNERINSERPIFSENLIMIGNSYSKLILASHAYEPNDESGLRSSMLSFRNSMQGTMEATACLLREIMKWPPVNRTFNESKRETEITLKNLMKDILDGLTIIDETTNN